MKTIRLVALSVSLLASSVFATRSAHAGQIATCTVSYVQVLNERVIVKCQEDPNEFNAWGSGWTACNSKVSSDTFKIFSALAQGALLSGKHLLMNYADDATCLTTTNAVWLIRLSGS